MQDFRVIQGTLPHKDYFDVQQKAYFSRRCKTKLRKTAVKVVNCEASPLAVFRKKLYDHE
jgi:hypothetical protein